jgi:hypothetical protein
MAATFEFQQDTGSATGSPAKGTTRTGSITNVNWKNSDVPGDAYSSYPIVAGNNSYTIFLFGKFTGSFNLISSGLWAHTSGTLGTGLTLKGVVTSTYATPATSTNSALTTDMTSAISIGAGATVNFHTTGPEGASPTSTLSSTGYTQYLATQLQTTSSAAAGDSATVTLTLQYAEN